MRLGIIHKQLQWQGSKTIKPKTKSCKINNPIITREIIQDIPHCFILEDEHAR